MFSSWYSQNRSHRTTSLLIQIHSSSVRRFTSLRKNISITTMVIISCFYVGPNHFFYCKQQYKISTFSLCVEQMPTEMSSNKLSINLCKISYPTDQSCQIRTLVIFPLSNLQQSGIIGLTSNIRSLVMVSGSNERNLSRSGNSKFSFSQTGCRYISCSLTFEYNTHIILIKKYRS